MRGMSRDEVWCVAVCRSSMCLLHCDERAVQAGVHESDCMYAGGSMENAAGQLRCDVLMLRTLFVRAATVL